MGRGCKLKSDWGGHSSYIGVLGEIKIINLKTSIYLLPILEDVNMLTNSLNN